jgi:hypothetical protein
LNIINFYLLYINSILFSSPIIKLIGRVSPLLIISILILIYKSLKFNIISPLKTKYWIISIIFIKIIKGLWLYIFFKLSIIIINNTIIFIEPLKKEGLNNLKTKYNKEKEVKYEIKSKQIYIIIFSKTF